MTRRLQGIGVILLAGCVLGGSGAKTAATIENAPYLGQKPPGLTAEVFAPGIVSTSKSELDRREDHRGTETRGVSGPACAARQ